MEILLIGGYNDKVEKNKELGLDLATDMKKVQITGSSGKWQEIKSSGLY